MSNQLITVVIPCFNSLKYIEAAVSSACIQDDENFEVLVVDNASTDGTFELLQSLKDNFNFTLVRNEKNIGAIANFNLAVELANGVYIKFLESDDELEPECLSVMRKHLSDQVQFVCGSKVFIDEKSMVIGVYKTFNRLVVGADIVKRFWITGNIIGTPSDCLVSKKLLIDVGGFSDRYDNYLNDLDVWLKICDDNNPIQFISDRVCKVRRHSEQMGATGGASLKDLEVAFKMLDENYFKDKRFHMETHFGAAYLYRALRRMSKLEKGNLIRTFTMLFSFLKYKVIFIVLYLPIYILLLVLSKNKK